MKLFDANDVLKLNKDTNKRIDKLVCALEECCEKF